MSKRLSKALSRRLSGRRAPSDLSNSCVRYQGVSVAFLQDFLERVLKGEEAAKTQLLVVQTDTQGLKEGATIELVREFEDGRLLCKAPFVGIKTLSSEDVVAKERKDWTIEDACEYAILPPCQRLSCFFLDLIEPKHVGKTYQGSFVSNARKSGFADLVYSLVEHFNNRNVPLDRSYVWLDIFCANQPKLVSKDQGLSEEIKKKRWDELTFGLHDAIKHFDDRLIFFNTWANPDPLQRAWCLWEIFGIIRSEKSIGVIFGPGTEDHLVETLKKSFHSIMQNLVDIDLRKAECHSDEDLKMIHNAVETSLDGGFTEVNNLIVGKLRDWLLESTKAVAARARRKDVSMSNEELGDVAWVLNQAGFLCSEHGQYKDALAFYKESLELCRKVLGNNHPFVAVRLNNIGLIYKAQGRFEEALKHYNEALTIDRKALGNRDPSVAIRLNNIGMVYYEQSKYNEALEHLSEAVEIDRAVFGNDHPYVAVRVNNIGMVYNAQGNFAEALKQFEMALEIDRKVFGNDHPAIATSLNNVGMVYKSQGKYDEAVQLYLEALSIDQKAYGKDHPTVAIRLHNLGQGYSTQGKYDDARKVITQALEIFTQTFGANHPSTKNAQNALDTLPKL